MFYFLPICFSCGLSDAVRNPRDGNLYYAVCGHGTGWPSVKHCLDCAERKDACMFCGTSLSADRKAFPPGSHDLRPNQTLLHVGVAIALGLLAMTGLYLTLH